MILLIKVGETIKNNIKLILSITLSILLLLLTVLVLIKIHPNNDEKELLVNEKRYN